MSDFESFTRDKISRLRAEADALEKILKEFQTAQARQAGASRRSGGDQPRSGAFGVVMEAIYAAGLDGMTLDDMVQAAEEEGYEVKRATLRSQVWKAKEEGALQQMEAGRYRHAALDANSGVVTVTRDPQDEGGYSEGGFRPAGRASDISAHDKLLADLDDEIPF